MTGRPRPCARAEHGTVVPWLLGLFVMVVFLGGLSIDLWRAFGVRQVLAGAVDAASIAGASAVDEAAFAAQDVVRLDPVEAERRAWASLAAQPAPGVLTDADVSATDDEIVVTARGELWLTLVRVLLPGRRSLRLEASAAASPRAAP